MQTYSKYDTVIIKGHSITHASKYGNTGIIKGHSCFQGVCRSMQVSQNSVKTGQLIYKQLTKYGWQYACSKLQLILLALVSAKRSQG